MKYQFNISVLMPVYNGGEYLAEAIESVLNQTYADFEFLIINDGSTDNSEYIVKGYAAKDKRIKYIENEKNLGLVKTLNRGLKLAKGKYIARMDADDVCHKERFLRQFNVMEDHPEISILGTSYDAFGSRQATYTLPASHEEIKIGLLFGSALCHPSVFIRNTFIQDNELQYLEETFPAEDYDFWVRSIKLGKIQNLKESLLCYREHEQQISSENERWQKKQTDKVRLDMLSWLNPEFDEKEKQFHIDVYISRSLNTANELKQCVNWTSRIIAANKQRKNFDQHLLYKRLKGYSKSLHLNFAINNCFRENRYNIKTLLCYYRSGVYLHISLKQNLKFIIKSLLNI